MQYEMTSLATVSGAFFLKKTAPTLSLVWVHNPMGERYKQLQAPRHGAIPHSGHYIQSICNAVPGSVLVIAVLMMTQLITNKLDTFDPTVWAVAIGETIALACAGQPPHVPQRLQYMVFWATKCNSLAIPLHSTSDVEFLGRVALPGGGHLDHAVPMIGQNPALKRPILTGVNTHTGALGCCMQAHHNKHMYTASNNIPKASGGVFSRNGC